MPIILESNIQMRNLQQFLHDKLIFLTDAWRSGLSRCANMTKLDRGAGDVGDSTAGLGGNLRP